MNRCFFSDPHKTHDTLNGQNVELLNVKLAVHIVTTGLWRVNVTGNPELFDSIHQRSSTPVTVHHHMQRL